MAKGYLVDDTQRCIRFRIPGSGEHVKFAISFDTLADCFGVVPPAHAFTQNRKSIHSVAEKVASGRPADPDGWVWILSADC
jgi:hypothetical protein